MNGYAVLITSGKHLNYYKQFRPDELAVAIRFFSVLKEGERGREADVVFTNDLELHDILIAQNAELDFNPLVIQFSRARSPRERELWS
jgi:hypothetical protein